MKGRAGVDEREGKREKKKKEKRKRTSLHLAFVSGRARKRGPHVPAGRRGKGQQEREKKR
jgi:hypothetical protein